MKPNLSRRDALTVGGLALIGTALTGRTEAQTPTPDGAKRPAGTPKSEASSVIKTRTASCNCGQLRVTCTGPDPDRVVMCNCYLCQKQTGSAFSVQARFPNEQVKIEGKSTAWQFPIKGAKPTAYRTCAGSDGIATNSAADLVTSHFCPECGSTKSILDFVARVTKAGSSDFVPVAERIATFDNDGTLWAEQPMYFQLLFGIDRIKELAPQHPEWQSQEPFKSVLAGDLKGAFAGGAKSLVELMAAGHSNMTTEDFDRTLDRWLATAKHPKTGRLYTEMVYQPMIELLAYLRANGFKTYIVSGGGADFMRGFAEQVYGIPPEQVIGSEGKLKFESRDGKPVLFKVPALDYCDDKEAKPIAIEKNIGRRPIAAFGNSDGDLQMLRWSCAGPGTRFCLFVRHTDAEREWAYDISPLGRLEKGLEEAKAHGWTVVDTKSEWKVIYPFEKK